MAARSPAGRSVGQSGIASRHPAQGMGRTPVFRVVATGVAWLGPVLTRIRGVQRRCTLFGIPTTRALAAVQSGEDGVSAKPPCRCGAEPASAASHLRVVRFRCFAHRGETENLASFDRLRHTAVHYRKPMVFGIGCVPFVPPKPILNRSVGGPVGFIHGVIMNTDNCAISGKTIRLWPLCL